MQSSLFPEMNMIPNCEKCGLYKYCKTPKMKPSGRGKYPVLIVGEAPGKEEDIQGRQFVGDSGEILRFMFEQFGFDMDDFRIINAVNCRPQNNKKPTVGQVKACFPMVYNEIKRFKPNVIFLVGETAVKSVLGHVYTKDVGGIGKWRGLVVPDQTYKAWLVPIYHPSYLLRRGGDSVLEGIIIKDIKRGIKLIDRKVPDYSGMLKRFRILTDVSDVISLLDSILQRKPELLAFDYETNALKPYSKKAKIYTASVCWGELAYSFPFYNHDGFVGKWRKLMGSDIPKIGANMKFEEVWTEEKLGVEIRNWKIDTVLMSHYFDRRSGITSLKFQTYLHFGISGYDSYIEKFLKADSGTKLNRIEEADINKVLEYNALDSLFTWEIGIRQIKKHVIMKKLIGQEMGVENEH